MHMGDALLARTTLSLAILTMVAVSQLPGMRTALADDWRTYHNDRYGTTIDYPSFFNSGTPPEADDGLKFTSADRAEFSVFASYNALGFDLAGFQDRIWQPTPWGAWRRLVRHLGHAGERSDFL